MYVFTGVGNNSILLFDIRNNKNPLICFQDHDKMGPSFKAIHTLALTDTIMSGGEPCLISANFDGLYLWERPLAAANNGPGLPTVMTSFDDIPAAPSELCHVLQSFKSGGDISPFFSNFHTFLH
jgi:hypothetical protein